MNVWAFDNPVAIEAALSANGAKAWRADIGKWKGSAAAWRNWKRS